MNKGFCNKHQAPRWPRYLVSSASLFQFFVRSGVMYLKYKMEQPMYMFTPEDTNMVDNSSTYVYSSVYSLLADFGSYLRSKNHSLSNAAKWKIFLLQLHIVRCVTWQDYPNSNSKKKEQLSKQLRYFWFSLFPTSSSSAAKWQPTHLNFVRLPYFLDLSKKAE